MALRFKRIHSPLTPRLAALSQATNEIEMKENLLRLFDIDSPGGRLALEFDHQTNDLLPFRSYFNSINMVGLLVRWCYKILSGPLVRDIWNYRFRSPHSGFAFDTLYLGVVWNWNVLDAFGPKVGYFSTFTKGETPRFWRFSAASYLYYGLGRLGCAL